MDSGVCQVEMLLLVESGHFWENVQGQCFLKWNLEHSGVRHTKHSACRGSIWVTRLCGLKKGADNRGRQSISWN